MCDRERKQNIHFACYLYPHPKCIPTLHWPLETLRQAFSEYRTAMQNAYACPFGLAIGVRLTAFTMS
jgi:hypothetical protein